jgi:hypothetical protein
MTRQYLSNDDLAQAPQFQLDEWRYNPDPMTRLRAEAESHRRLRELLADAGIGDVAAA